MRALSLSHLVVGEPTVIHSLEVLWVDTERTRVVVNGGIVVALRVTDDG
jgi:hypothetical protein